MSQNTNLAAGLLPFLRSCTRLDLHVQHCVLPEAFWSLRVLYLKRCHSLGACMPQLDAGLAALPALGYLALRKVLADGAAAPPGSAPPKADPLERKPIPGGSCAHETSATKQRLRSSSCALRLYLDASSETGLQLLISARGCKQNAAPCRLAGGYA